MKLNIVKILEKILIKAEKNNTFYQNILDKILKIEVKAKQQKAQKKK
ncbi:MAG: hypothetical protein ACOCRO_08560 [Halanaerobiales bacterium]